MYQWRRRKPNRLKNFDYSKSGWYFVTICTQNREYLFGQAENGKMILNAVGKIVARCWYDLPRHYPNCRLDEFIIMPNHLHGIIVITGDRRVDDDVGTNNTVGTIHELSLQRVSLQLNRRRMLLPKIIGFLKMNSAKQINQIRKTPSNPVWQRSFYDHIIRNEKSYWQIKKYIYENPLHWLDDRNYVK